MNDLVEQFQANVKTTNEGAAAARRSHKVPIRRPISWYTQPWKHNKQYKTVTKWIEKLPEHVYEYLMSKSGGTRDGIQKIGKHKKAYTFIWERKKISGPRRSLPKAPRHPKVNKLKIFQTVLNTFRT